MTGRESDRLQIIRAALAGLRVYGPSDLAERLRRSGGPGVTPTDDDVTACMREMLSSDPNDGARLATEQLLHDWDNAEPAEWGKGTRRNTRERRNVVYDLLGVDEEFRSSCEKLIPPYTDIEEPLVIAEEHEHWYTPERRALRSFYWDALRRFLMRKPGWSEQSVFALDHSSNCIVERLSDPERRAAFQTRGLVVGYVQSGKTTNFTAVIAKAADAGYRLFIVLAGTVNILRDQTQRRLDKELVGWELLGNVDREFYETEKDAHEFLRHGYRPSERGFFDWYRLTGPKYDYQSLKKGIQGLEFNRVVPTKRLIHPRNLHRTRAQLIVVKKHSGILQKVISDFASLEETRLDDVPTLVIDDESDQASINTLRPDTGRTRINERIMDLLKRFPRVQYLGYTATPYASVLINPDDPEDLFPRDYIISLDKPKEYRGVDHFFGPDGTTGETDETKRYDYIRGVEGDDLAPENLQRALDSFILAGAIKLFRHEKDPTLVFKHHTMLMHRSHLRASHDEDKEKLQTLYGDSAYTGKRGLARLEKLWQDDFAEVSHRRAADLPLPDKFGELESYIAQCLVRIDRGDNPVLVVNGDSDDAPNFEAGQVWKILVGGNKFSRGYTVEGLTVSYFRRAPSAADTLMQAGRWFGFRRGYHDLVRLYAGTREPWGPRGTVNLVEEFEHTARMEEDFRLAVQRYIRPETGTPIRPKQVPPLISSLGALTPTSGNKMYNAVIRDENFGGSWSETTLAPTDSASIEHNQQAFRRLLATEGTSIASSVLASMYRGVRHEPKALHCRRGNKDVSCFLKEYRWLEGRTPETICRQIDFLEKRAHGIARWLIVSFQTSDPYGSPWRYDHTDFAVRNRARVDSGRRFKVYTEPLHRAAAEFLAGVSSRPGRELESPSRALSKLREEGLGILLFYPVRDAIKEEVSIGFSLLYPPNKLPYVLKFGVVSRDEANAVVVDREEE